MFGKLLNSSRNADITLGKFFGNLQKTVVPFWTIVRKLSLIFVDTNFREKTKSYFAHFWIQVMISERKKFVMHIFLKNVLIV